MQAFFKINHLFFKKKQTERQIFIIYFAQRDIYNENIPKGGEDENEFNKKSVASVAVSADYCGIYNAAAVCKHQKSERIHNKLNRSGQTDCVFYTVSFDEHCGGGQYFNSDEEQRNKLPIHQNNGLHIECGDDCRIAHGDGEIHKGNHRAALDLRADVHGNKSADNTFLHN